MPNEPGIIPKFSTVLLFGLIWLCKKIKPGKGSVRMSFRTRRWHLPSRNHEPFKGSFGLQEAYTKACPNSAKKITATCWCHVMTPSQVSFHPCFGFTGIKKTSFSMFPAEPRRPDVWISFPFLAWDLEIHPTTHMWFSNQLWCTGACACSSNFNYAH